MDFKICSLLQQSLVLTFLALMLRGFAKWWLPEPLPFLPCLPPRTVLSPTCLAFLHVAQLQ